MKSSNILNITGGILLLFGVVTLVVSSAVLFDWGEMREKEGDYVLFVVIANFLCSFLYLYAVYGFFRKKIWTPKVLTVAVIILVITFIVLGVHIFLGGVYEEKTIYAMIFRILTTLGFLYVASRYLPK